VGGIYTLNSNKSPVLQPNSVTHEAMTVRFDVACAFVVSCVSPPRLNRRPRRMLSDVN
jgi:hypothetical protein